jgi:hypothetical protein
VTFIHLPYTNNFLKIALKCSIHIIIKIEFRVSPTVFLQKVGIQL